MIVKIQIPLATNEPYPRALVYNQTREFQALMPVTEVEDIMGDRPKAFFHAEMTDDGLEIGEEAKWQNW